MYERPPGYGTNARAEIAAHVAGLSTPPVTVEHIANGYPGTMEIVERMKAAAADAVRDEGVNQLARRLTIGLPARDHFGEAARLLRYMQDNFRWTRLPNHPLGMQRLQTPRYTLFDAPAKTGECASLSTALAALLMALGHEVGFRVAGTTNDPDFFEHVYLIDYSIANEPVALDPSYDLAAGVEHPGITVRQDVKIA